MSVGGYAQRDYDDAFEAGHAQALQEIRDPVTEEPAEWPGDVLTCDINQLSGWLDACLDGIDRTQFRSIGWLRDFQQLTAAPPSEASR